MLRRMPHMLCGLLIACFCSRSASAVVPARIRLHRPTSSTEDEMEVPTVELPEDSADQSQEFRW